MCTCVQMCTMCFCVVNQHSKSAFRDTKCQTVVMKAKVLLLRPSKKTYNALIVNTSLRQK